MKVNVEISEAYKVPYAVIYTAEVTTDIQRAMDILGSEDAPITAQNEDRIMILKAEDIYMVRVEGGKTVIYGKKDIWYSTKRLYEISGCL